MEAELIGFIIAGNLVLLILIAGIIFFVVQYRRRRRQYDKEKEEQAARYELELMSVKLDTRQQTMQHIGREIHDNVGQKLTLASLYLRQQLQLVNTDPDKMQKVAGIIDESLTDLRLLSKTLTNPLLADASLDVLLKEEAERINAAGLCYVSITGGTKSIQLKPAIKNTAFRLLQEFIQNSLKHAQCSKINLQLSTTAGRLQIQASDDGRGFDTETESGGIGLQNMKRRAEEMHAVFKLESLPGSGTRLKLEIPY